MVLPRLRCGAADAAALALVLAVVVVVLLREEGLLLAIEVPLEAAG